jgi:redox-sensing transcriptional repressor
MEIPPVVIDRLPVYARALSKLEEAGREVVSSQELGTSLGVTPAQIRKDLSYFGRFGKQGRGYNVRKLLDELRRILGLDKQWRMALVGVGKLGRAILGYEGFAPQGFRIVEAFDTNPKRINERINNLTIKNVDDLEATLMKNPVDVGIVAVPADIAQDIIDGLIKCGVRAILNYAPIAAHVPRGIQIKRIEPVLALQSMTYYMKNAGRAAARARS